MTTAPAQATRSSWRQMLFPAGLIQRLLLGLILLNLLVAGLAAWSLHQSRIKDDENAALETQNLTLLLEQELGSSLRAIDLTLQVLVREIERPVGVGKMDLAALGRLVERLQFMHPELSGLRLANPQGLVTMGTGVASSPVVSVADRDYFLQLRNTPNAGLFVSKPVSGRISGSWGISLARAIRREDGSFSGLVVATIPLSRLTKAYEALSSGPGGSFTLFDPQLRIIVRSSDAQNLEATSGKKISTPELEELVKNGHSFGSYKSVSSVDGVERQFSYRHVQGFPLNISVGRATADYLAAWRTEVRKTIAQVIFFMGITLVLFWLVRRTWQKQEQAVIALNEANQNLIIEKNFSQAVFESSPLPIYVQDQKGRVKHLNQSAEKMFGWRYDEIVGKSLLSVPTHKVKETEDLRLRVLNGESIVQFETQRVNHAGELIDLSTTSTPLRLVSGEVDGFLTIALDITERKAAAKQIEFLAYRDVLTGLPNRLLLQDRFQQALAYADREGVNVALLFLDLDNFKSINDSLGHVVGDHMLKGVATRLAECVRGADTISRQGGDEFMVVLSDLRGPDAITPVLHLIRERLRAPFKLDGQELTTSASIGIAIYPDDGRDFDTLLKKADTAMYRAKEGGANHYRFFDEQMNVEAVEHLRLKSGMRTAIERGEFDLYYQPQIDLVTGAVVGVESLIRWNDPESGMVSPGKFIPVIESSELIVPIGEWVIHEACRQAMSWRKAGLPPLVMAVNLSAVQFRRGDVEKTVIHALEASGLDPRYLELELTESVLVHDTELVLSTVQRLKRLGVTLSIDDFGTGYSSLSYLKRFDVDKLKIDQSFIRELTTNQDDMAIVRAIIQMARSMNLKTIAEGVEQAGMVETLKLFGCDEAQGYHFAAPMTAQAFVAFIAKHSLGDLAMGATR